MDKDAEIQSNVLEELLFDPQVDAAAIGVSVNDGVVSLTGHVSSFAEKVAAEKATQRVKGVRAIVQNVEVRLDDEAICNDEEIATRAANVLAWSVTPPKKGVKVRVDNGWVTLHGDVKWAFQRDDAERAIRRLTGIKGVSNMLVVTNTANANDISNNIKRAFHRNAEVDAGAINIAVDGSKVTLTGKVRAWSERMAAEQAAWATPGVSQIVDHISIQ
jgi:osmotically-inducible protein OsmY